MAAYQIRAGRRIPSGEYDAIRELALRPGPPLSPAQVYRELERRFDRRPVVSKRTVQRVLAEARRRIDESDVWTLLDSAPAEAKSVLELIPLLGGRPAKAVASAYARVVDVVPDIEPLRAYYLAALVLGQDRSYLEEYVALAPWRDRGARMRAAVRAGFAPNGVIELDALVDRMVKASRAGVAAGAGAAYDATVKVEGEKP
jgi:hypothetical protein